MQKRAKGKAVLAEQQAGSVAAAGGKEHVARFKVPTDADTYGLILQTPVGKPGKRPTGSDVI
jgi:hypothetical protein